MKLFLPASFIVLAAASCCCCGSDMQELLEKQGIDMPSDLGTPGVGTGVRATQSVPKGSVVTIADIHSEDAYYSDRSNIIGKTCTLGEDSSFKDGEWHGGSVACGSDSYYFYKAAYEVVSAAAAVAPPVITGSRATASVPSGSTVVIVDVHSEDAYYADRSNIIGKTCTLSEASSFKDGEWHGGPVMCGSDSYYFYKAAYQVSSAAAAPAPSAGGADGRATSMVANGSTVVIMDIHSEDAYYSDRTNIIGKTCVLSDNSSFKDGEWHGGPVMCGSDSYYFYKAAYKVQ